MKRGDQFVFRGGARRGRGFVCWPADGMTIFVQVTRVAKDATWADIRCFTWATSFAKRQPLPLASSFIPQGWTPADVAATKPSHV